MNNKYQESLDRFKVVAQNDWLNNYQKCKDEEKTIHIGNYRMFEIDGEAIKTLQELVGKETPMKVVTWEIAKPITRCPKCGAGVERKDSYCWECGQKIDWSEE